MKIAILETVVPSGHEVEYDRGLVEACKNLGHTPVFFVPKNYPFKTDYGTEIEELNGGEAISYSHAGFFKKAILSAKREFRRRCWFNSARKIAREKDFSLIFIPTATPRYLRAILGSSLCKSEVPVVVNLQVFSFEKKGRLEQFISLAKKVEKFSNVHITITSPNHVLTDLPNVSYLNPPFYEPTLIKPKAEYDGRKVLTLGLYGFYRDDRNVKKLFEILSSSDFKRDFRIVIQAVTNNQKDEDSCRELISKYSDNPRFIFTKEYLRDESWQKALDETDVILAPYSSRQYVYTYSAMCFNALGFKKPVILSSNVNPEVTKEFDVGLSLDFDNDVALKDKLVNFIDSFDDKYPHYLSEIARAKNKYNFENVVKDILKFSSAE